METEPTGEYMAIVVRLRPGTDGTWYLDVEGTHSAKDIPVVPMTLVIRLWRPTGTNLLRGTIRLRDGDGWAPIQSNSRLEELVRDWLFGGDSGAVSGSGSNGGSYQVC